MTLIKRDGVFKLGQRNNLAFTLIQSLDTNDTYYEATPLVTDRWVFQGFSVLVYDNTFMYTSIVDKAISQFGLTMNTTTHTPFD